MPKKEEEVEEERIVALSDVIECIGEVEGLLEHAPVVPLSNRKMVNEDEFFIALQRLRSKLSSVSIEPEDSGLRADDTARLQAGGGQAVARLQRESTLLLIVDVQQKLMPAIHEAERVEKNCILLARAARQLELPVIITEQYPERLGATLPAVRELLLDAPHVPKMCFSACTESTLGAIEATGRKTILLCGVEAHVCVLQTALDLREREYSVFVARDAISSRTPENAEVGWQRMMGVGVLPTSTESAIFELLREAGTPDFKALLPYLK